MLLSLLVTGTFVSCKEDAGDVDGLWDAMKWETSVKSNQDGYIQVDNTGGTFEFKCTNYSKPWFAEVAQSDDNNTYQHTYAHEQKDFRTINTDWLSAKFVGNVLTINFLPTTQDAPRYITVTVTVGDTGHTFKFKQN